MFAVITYEVTNQPRAQAGGFATAHQNPPGIRLRSTGEPDVMRVRRIVGLDEWR